MKTYAALRQAENLLDFPLSCCHARVAPKIKLAPSREQFLRGLSFHKGILGLDLQQLQRVATGEGQYVSADLVAFWRVLRRISACTKVDFLDANHRLGVARCLFAAEQAS